MIHDVTHNKLGNGPGFIGGKRGKKFAKNSVNNEKKEADDT